MIIILGGDGEKDVEDEEESHSKVNREQDLGRLNKFLEKAGQVSNFEKYLCTSHFYKILIFFHV